MKHPIKMNRIKHILAITLSLLLIAIIADAQVSQRRRAQQPQRQANKYEYKNKLFTHECKSGECFDIYHTNNDEYFVKRLNDCRQPIYIRYGFRKKAQKKNLQIREPSICLNTTKVRLNSIALKHHKGMILPLITLTQPTIKKSEKG